MRRRGLPWWRLAAQAASVSLVFRATWLHRKEHLGTAETTPPETREPSLVSFTRKSKAAELTAPEGRGSKNGFPRDGAIGFGPGLSTSPGWSSLAGCWRSGGRFRAGGA